MYLLGLFQLTDLCFVILKTTCKVEFAISFYEAINCADFH